MLSWVSGVTILLIGHYGLAEWLEEQHFRHKINQYGVSGTIGEDIADAAMNARFCAWSHQAVLIGKSPRTVSTHVGNILNKIGANSRVEATNYANQHGLATPIADEGC